MWESLLVKKTRSQGYASLLVKRRESELLFMQEQVFFGLTTKLQLISLLDIVKAHFVKITFSALSVFFLYSIPLMFNLPQKAK